MNWPYSMRNVLGIVVSETRGRIEFRRFLLFGERTHYESGSLTYCTYVECSSFIYR